ncbi:MAG: GNAT family N-acetyltransferase [Microbacteriaceae bacterium]|nr:GNAT family N-acetyltransferase [Microbacteriaceae bacterium]
MRSWAVGGIIRRYRAADASATLSVFLLAVRKTASAHYDARQVAVWAPDDIDLAEWGRTRAAVATRVAEIDGHVVGFTDLDGAGHVDMLFVHPSFGRRGVASALFETVLADARRVGLTTLTVDASLTARAFFERNGFVVVAQQHVERNGVRLTNFRMRLELTG